MCPSEQTLALLEHKWQGTWLVCLQIDSTYPQCEPST